MNEEKLSYFTNHLGFIAALDQSGGSTPQTLLNYGINSSEYSTEATMFDLVHQMRTRILTAKSFNSNYLVGTILFKDTANRIVNDELTTDYLWNKKQILPFVKIDQGLDEKKDGVQLMKPLDDIDTMLDFAVAHNAFGTKERSVIFDNNKQAIKNVVDQQFDIAQKVIQKGLVPIIEPEVNIYAKEKSAIEVILFNELKKHLSMLGDSSSVVIKITLPSNDNLYLPLTHCKNVVKVVALSGGYSRKEACEKLKRNRNIIASFSRALTEGLKVAQTDNEFEQTLHNNICMIYDASFNKI